MQVVLIIFELLSCFFLQEFLITTQNCLVFMNWSKHFPLQITTPWNFFLGIYAGTLHHVSITQTKRRDIMTPRVITPFFCLSQSHPIRGGQSHDRAECGNRIWPDSASAGDGVGQHHHAHGLSEPDSGVHPERIRAYLLLQLKQDPGNTKCWTRSSYLKC